MENTIIKYTVNLDELPVDAKGYDVVETGNAKKPFKIEGVEKVDMVEYLKDKDLTELATRSAVIDIQRDSRNTVKVALGIASKRETAENVRAGQLERLLAMKGELPEDQYENMKRLIMGS